VKIVTILGTRPEIIRLCLVIEKLDASCEHVLVHTGQNFDPNLSDLFFEELEVRQPDHFLGVRGRTFGEQAGQILSECERVLIEESPDRLLILGDTNSGLSAVVAKRLGIPIYHMEAGNRCYDDRVPEEVNRRVIDHSSDVLLPYTRRSRAHLLREGIPEERILITGNPIWEVISHFRRQIDGSGVLCELGLAEGEYFLVTMHRAENVDVKQRLLSLAEALDRVQRRYGVPVVVSTHPRTKAKLSEFEVIRDNADVRFLDPFGFFDFVKLEQHAKCVLTDSGTVQEETCILRIPNVTIRDVTERPETIECGSNMLAGVEPERIVEHVQKVLASKPAWQPPEEYTRRPVATTKEDRPPVKVPGESEGKILSRSQ